MPENRSQETPLDLVQAGRDELIEGTGPVRIVLHGDPDSEQLRPAMPDQNVHRHAAQRELQSQSAILSHAGD